MLETWQYIEAYFEQVLSGEERTAFEARCVQDEAFAREVAFYLTARSAAHEVLMEEKQKTFTAGTLASKHTTQAVPVRKIQLRKWLSYAAAACLVFVIATIFYMQAQRPAQLAANYVQDKYVHHKIGISMDASRDSMQLGIEAYNNGNYKRAQVLFDGLRQRDTANSDAKKYAGLAYLETKDYDKALACFEALAAMQGLHINSGDLLSAATLLQRNAPSDKDKAKKLLQKVVDRQEEGSTQAKEWLENL